MRGFARLATFVLLLLPAATLADPPHAYKPFDMSPERPAGEVQPEKKQESGRTPGAAPNAEQAATPAQPPRRYLIPFPQLRLGGEIASRNWIVYLTPAEARSAQTLNYGYTNAVFVAPEMSNLSIYINDRLIEQKPIRSSEGVSQRVVTIPPDLLRAGVNRLSFSVIQQHRTDCTIASTYDLWTDIVPDKTYLALARQTTPPTPNIDDVKAIGVDDKGRTQFNIVVPAPPDLAQSEAVMRLAQGLALMGRMPSQSVTVGTTLDATPRPGRINVVVGPAAQIAGLVPEVPISARSGDFVGFVKGRKAGETILLVSGPTWQSVTATIEKLVSPFERPPGVERSSLWTRAWRGYDAPLLTIGTRLALSTLGVASTEFRGRRFRTSFDVGVPADFYANGYGTTTLFLDAAYSEEVLPGSSINIYVNGNLASTVPISSPGGAILRHLPIRITMRHFRPGLNQFDIEALLPTDADRVCAPTAAQSDEPRFALFNTSELDMPTFARLVRLPSFEATTETGFPYGEQFSPIPLFVNRIDSQTLSTAATFLGKLALASGRPLKTQLATATTGIGEDNAIFIGPISQIPPAAMSRVHLTEESRNTWGNTALADAIDPDSRSADFDAWGRRVRGSTLLGRINSFGQWLTETFDISPDALQFLPPEDVDLTPANSTSFLAAQGMSPNGNGIWTVLAAPDSTKLENGMQAMADVENWEAMGGHLVYYKEITHELESIATTNPHFVQTQPFSLNNYRLIAANWLSQNTFSYAVAIVVLAVLLGLATSLMLNRFGRRA